MWNNYKSINWLIILRYLTMLWVILIEFEFLSRFILAIFIIVLLIIIDLQFLFSTECYTLPSQITGSTCTDINYIYGVGCSINVIFNWTLNIISSSTVTILWYHTLSCFLKCVLFHLVFYGVTSLFGIGFQLMILNNYMRLIILLSIGWAIYWLDSTMMEIDIFIIAINISFFYYLMMHMYNLWWLVFEMILLRRIIIGWSCILLNIYRLFSSSVHVLSVVIHRTRTILWLMQRRIAIRWGMLILKRS